MKQFILSFILVCSITVGSKCYGKIVDRTAIYSAMKSGDLKEIDDQLSSVEKDTTTEAKAFEGALLMKKAGVVGNPFKKLKLFKRGHELLEGALKDDNDNAEFRFLRLMIQEHAPGIVNYNDDLQTDSAAIQSDFKNLSKELQEVILEYSKQSKVLTPANFRT